MRNTDPPSQWYVEVPTVRRQDGTIIDSETRGFTDLGEAALLANQHGVGVGDRWMRRVPQSIVRRAAKRRIEKLEGMGEDPLKLEVAAGRIVCERSDVETDGQPLTRDEARNLFGIASGIAFVLFLAATWVANYFMHVR